jgi:hypothetical protein
MPEPHSTTAVGELSPNGVPLSELEARLRHFFGEQRRLRELLERTRAELTQVNAGLLSFQDQYCTSEAREEEYLQCLERVLGYRPQIDLKEIEEANNNPQTIEEFLAELEGMEGTGKGI